eukprot:Hpha_TRINITY_DN11819_c1_g1::TRINITY_DN11819_c1_g1_i1::g.2209::m.2209
MHQCPVPAQRYHVPPSRRHPNRPPVGEHPGHRHPSLPTPVGTPGGHVPVIAHHDAVPTTRCKTRRPTVALQKVVRNLDLTALVVAPALQRAVLAEREPVEEPERNTHRPAMGAEGVGFKLTLFAVTPRHHLSILAQCSGEETTGVDCHRSSMGFKYLGGWWAGLTHVVVPPALHSAVLAQRDGVAASRSYRNGTTVLPDHSVRNISLPFGVVPPSHNLPVRREENAVVPAHSNSSRADQGGNVAYFPTPHQCGAVCAYHRRVMFTAGEEVGKPLVRRPVSSPLFSGLTLRCCPHPIRLPCVRKRFGAARVVVRMVSPSALHPLSRLPLYCCLSTQ